MKRLAALAAAICYEAATAAEYMSRLPRETPETRALKRFSSAAYRLGNRLWAVTGRTW